MGEVYLQERGISVKKLSMTFQRRRHHVEPWFISLPAVSDRLRQTVLHLDKLHSTARHGTSSSTHRSSRDVVGIALLPDERRSGITPLDCVMAERYDMGLGMKRSRLYFNPLSQRLLTYKLSLVSSSRMTTRQSKQCNARPKQ